MSQYKVVVAGIIPSSPSKVYRILSDYRQHHSRIIPPEYFRSFQVIEGGIGAGTRTRFEVHVLGQVREVEHLISEPEPGRVLMESEPDGSFKTRFRVEPLEGGAATRLTIESEISSRPGLQGALEKWMTSMMLRRIYRKELARIAAYAPGVPP